MEVTQAVRALLHELSSVRDNTLIAERERYRFPYCLVYEYLIGFSLAFGESKAPAGLMSAGTLRTVSLRERVFASVTESLASTLPRNPPASTVSLHKRGSMLLPPAQTAAATDTAAGAGGVLLGGGALPLSPRSAFMPVVTGTLRSPRDSDTQVLEVLSAVDTAYAALLMDAAPDWLRDK